MNNCLICNKCCDWYFKNNCSGQVYFVEFVEDSDGYDHEFHLCETHLKEYNESKNIFLRTV